MTTISRFAVVSTISLSILASICIATTQPYIIYPARNISQTESEGLSHVINAISEKWYDYTRWEKTIPEFWVAWLNTAAYESFRSDLRIREIHLSKVVAQPVLSVESTYSNNSSPVEAPSEVGANTSVGLDGGYPEDPNYTIQRSSSTYSTQFSPRATDLRILSQPPGPLSWQRYENYVYETGGIQTYIYHVELGVNPHALDVQKSRIEWLYTPEAYFWRLDYPSESFVRDEPFGHSTCTASKAAGTQYGAAKEAILVVVKMIDYTEPSIISGLKVVADDIKQKGRGGKSVVSISWGSKAAGPGILGLAWAVDMLETLKELYDNGVIVVCSAGNDAQMPGPTGLLRDIIDTAPAMFVDRVIAVGSSYFDGVRQESSQRLIGRPQLYAPGVDVKCADATGRKLYQVGSGTSFSAPLVAGIIAGFLASGQIRFPLGWDQLSNFLYNRAGWRRKFGGEYLIWDLVDKAHNEPKPLSGNASASNLTASFFESSVPGNGQFDVTTD